MAKESRKNNPNISEQESEGKKKDQDRNPKSQSTNQEEVKEKQSADKKKLESKTSPKDNNQSTSDWKQRFEEFRNNIKLFMSERDEIGTNVKSAKQRKNLKEKWAQMHKRAKLYAAGGDFISDIGKAIASGYSKGKSLR